MKTCVGEANSTKSFTETAWTNFTGLMPSFLVQHRFQPSSLKISQHVLNPTTPSLQPGTLLCLGGGGLRAFLKPLLVRAIRSLSEISSSYHHAQHTLALRPGCYTKYTTWFVSQERFFTAGRAITTSIYVVRALSPVVECGHVDRQGGGK